MNWSYVAQEQARAQAFESIWANDIDAVFSDVARYYDRANIFASLGLLNILRERFLSTIDIRPNQKVLDVCAGTNVIGIDLLKRQPSLDVYAVDRSMAMQEVGRSYARRRGFQIKGFICDVHQLPFPDNYFDIVTLQWATRHFGSGPAALKCQNYFVEAIRMFYSTQELSDILSELGYSNVVGNSMLGGTVAFHKACKPQLPAS